MELPERQEGVGRGQLLALAVSVDKSDECKVGWALPGKTLILSGFRGESHVFVRKSGKTAHTPETVSNSRQPRHGLAVQPTRVGCGRDREAGAAHVSASFCDPAGVCVDSSSDQWGSRRVASCRVGTGAEGPRRRGIIDPSEVLAKRQRAKPMEKVVVAAVMIKGLQGVSG